MPVAGPFLIQVVVARLKVAFGIEFLVTGQRGHFVVSLANVDKARCLGVHDLSHLGNPFPSEFRSQWGSSGARTDWHCSESNHAIPA